MSLSYADRKQLVLSVTDAEREASAARRLPVLELLALEAPRLVSFYGLRHFAVIGSYAYGNLHEASDLDICTDLPKCAVRNMLRDELRELTGITLIDLSITEPSLWDFVRARAVVLSHGD